MSDAIKQLSFHVDLNGCPVPEPAYARKVREENAKANSVSGQLHQAAGVSVSGTGRGGGMSRTLQRLLRDSGLVLLRQNVHMVWRHPSGRNFITASTPSDSRAEIAVRTSLRRFLRAQGATL